MDGRLEGDMTYYIGSDKLSTLNFTHDEEAFTIILKN